MFRGYKLYRRNLWSGIIQQWDCRYTALSVVGPGPDAPAFASAWRARVAGIDADDDTLEGALECAWSLAESEGQTENLLKPEL